MSTQEQAAEAFLLDRAVSINLLRTTRSLAVRCIPGEKKPAKGWDPRSNTETVSLKVIDDVEFNQDNFGIHLTGRWVDVDVDTDNPIMFAALDAFLPESPHVWGRASKPRSHRLYMSSDDDFDPSMYPFLRKLKRIPEAKVEARGGPVSRAEYSLMPGSVHPSGELYTWHHTGYARNTPVQVPIRSILDGIRKATAVAVLAPYFTEGVRQEITMAMAGFLQRVHQLTGEWAEETDGFAMNYETAIDFWKTFLQIVEDDKSDRRDRLAAFKITWDKGAGGTAVTGASRIAEIASDKGIVQKLYALLTDNPDVQRLDTFLQRYAIWHGTGDLVDLDAAETGSKPIMSRMAASNSMGHEWYQVGEKRVKMIDYLYNLETTTRVNGFDFAPGKPRLLHKPNGSIKVNQWGGFAVKPDFEAGTPTDTEMAPLINYIKGIVCRNREDVYEWVMAWLADVFQDPGEKPGTALVLVGAPGAGKSSLGDIIRAVIGENHAAQTNDIESVTAKHNSMFVNQLFVQCDEATNSRQKATSARLKSLITDPTQKAEPKGVDPYQTSALARFMFTSNDITDAVHIPDGIADRRFTVAEVSSERVGDIDYWDEFRLWWKSNLGRIMAYFSSWTYDKKMIRKCLITPEKKRMVTASWSGFDRWVITTVETQHPISLRHHTRPAMAVQDRADPGIAIVRDQWPRYVDMQAVAATLADATRGGGGRGAPSLPDVLADLRRAGLSQTPSLARTMVREFDDRTSTQIINYYTYVELAPIEKFIEYVTNKLGQQVSRYTITSKTTEETEF